MFFRGEGFTYQAFTTLLTGRENHKQTEDFSMMAQLQHNEVPTQRIFLCTLQEQLLSSAGVEFPSGSLSLTTNPQGSWKKKPNLLKDSLQSTGIPAKESSRKNKRRRIIFHSPLN